MKHSDLWTLLKNHQERIGVVASLLALAVGVVSSLTDRSNPPIIALSLFSVAAAAYCVWLFFKRQPSSSGKTRTAPSRSSRVRNVSVALIVILTVSTMWAFIYRVQIQYSELADQLIGSKRVLVSKDVAKHILRKEGPPAFSVYTILDDLETVLTNSEFRIVLMDEQSIEAYIGHQPNIQPRDQFILTGDVNELGASLTVRLPINEPRYYSIKRWYDDLVESSPDGVAHPETIYPYYHYLPFQFFFSFFEITLPVPVSSSETDKIASVQIGLRYVLAQTLHLNDESTAPDVYRDILRLAPLVQDVRNVTLSKIYKGVAYYYATQGAPRLAQQALEFARNAAPSDQEVHLMASFVHFTLDEFDAAIASLDMIEPNESNRAFIHGLRSDLAQKTDDIMTSIEEMKQVLKYESEPSIRGKVATLLSASYARVGKIDSRRRGSSIIEYASMATEITPENYVPWVLLGYGWALRGNTENFSKAFRKAQKLPSATNNQQFISYWLAKCRLELGNQKEALATLERALQGSEGKGSASMLYLYAKALLNNGGDEDEVEEKLRQVLTIEPEYSSANSLLASVLIERLKREPVNASDRVELVREVNDLLTSSLATDETRYGHSLLATLYELEGDEINADKHRRRDCTLSPKTEQCLFNLIWDELKRDELDIALSNLELLAKMPEVESELQVEMIHFTTGFARHKAGDLLKAEMAYEKAIATDSDGDLGAQNNLAFVKFDLGLILQAFKLWELELKINPVHADAIAGRAIALASLGKAADALDGYRLAVQQEVGYLDLEWMKHERFWSPKTLAAATPLITAINEANDRKGEAGVSLVRESEK